MEIRRLDSKDVAAAWQINEQGLPGTGKVSHDEMADLFSLSELPIGVFDGDEMLGFVLCLTPRTRYASLNYAWFNQRYQEFCMSTASLLPLNTETEALVHCCMGE